MRILVTGAEGQVGQTFLAALSNRTDHCVFGAARSQLDVTDPIQVEAVVRHFRPDVILHAAAYTAVDKAESMPDVAFQVNQVGARNVARSAADIKAKVCYLSTDYVFDGTSLRPYRTDDIPFPINVYGKSKLAGEQEVVNTNPRHFVVRTSWVFGETGANFVKTMLRLADQGGIEGLRVVDDQIGRPTYAKDLVEFLLALISTENYGIHHACNDGTCSWYEFAREIFAYTGRQVQIHPVDSHTYIQAASRPKYSVLDLGGGFDDGPSPMRHWTDALHQCLDELMK